MLNNDSSTNVVWTTTNRTDQGFCPVEPFDFSTNADAAGREAAIEIDRNGNLLAKPV
jgi:hypothetical protein